MGRRVTVSGLRFRSVCEHHLLPFEGEAEISYILGDRIAGIGRLRDTLHVLSGRLQLQERLGQQLAEVIAQGLHSPGAEVRLVADHLCATNGPGASAVRLTTVATAALPVAADHGARP